ncbi:MAG: HEAT repeat domain-containing protein [Planctomycetota bacterium]|jgi:HEAT repeat protein
MKSVLFGLVLIGLLNTACTEEQSRRPAGSQTGSVRVKTLKPRATVILEKALKSDNSHLRSAAIEVMVDTQQKDFLPEVTALTTDPIVPVRFNAMVALGDLRCRSCEKIMRKSLSDPDVNVRIAAAYALVKINQPKFIDQVRAAAKSSDHTVQANAALLLGKLGNPDNIELLYELLQDSNSSDKVRMQAVESIARLGDERMYRSKLWALLISKFADDRAIGIRGMGALNTAESRNAIRSALDDDVQEVRLVAAEQLARLGDTSGEEVVFAYFKTQPDLNKVDMASQMAVMAIGPLKSGRLNSQLPPALDSQSPYIQLMAARSVLLQL